MKAKEIFEDVLNAVSQHTGLNQADILSNRSAECTDARYILVRYLQKLLPCPTVASLIGRTRQGVHSILARQKSDTFWVESNWKAIVKQLGSKYFISK